MLLTGVWKFNRVLCMCVTNLRVCLKLSGFSRRACCNMSGAVLSPERDYSLWLLSESCCMLSEAANLNAYRADHLCGHDEELCIILCK